MVFGSEEDDVGPASTSRRGSTPLQRLATPETPTQAGPSDGVWEPVHFGHLEAQVVPAPDHEENPLDVAGPLPAPIFYVDPEADRLREVNVRLNQHIGFMRSRCDALTTNLIETLGAFRRQNDYIVSLQQNAQAQTVAIETARQDLQRYENEAERLRRELYDMNVSLTDAQCRLAAIRDCASEGAPLQVKGLPM